MKKVVVLSFVAGWLQAQVPGAGKPPIPPQTAALAATFQQGVKALQAAAPPSPKNPKNSRKTPRPEITGTIDGNSIEVERQAALPPNARQGLALSESWLASGPNPVADAEGRVVYAYGKGLPTVVCSVLQVCELDLQPGETPEKDALDWGDHRFEVATRTAGSGGKAFTYLVLKPTQTGLDTTMTIGTNKRPYYVRLVSTGHDHMARVAFSYLAEDQQGAKPETSAAAEVHQAEELKKHGEEVHLASLNTDRPLRNWAYRVKMHGKDAAYLRPEKIGDDGTHTHIVLSEEARHRGLPVVQLQDARGPIPANARWAGNELIVDAVFDHACLLAGVGRGQQRACISNDGLRGTHDAHH